MSPGYTRYAPVAGPSRWLLVAGRRFVAVVESSVADAIIDTVWWLADSELATIESVVGAFPLTGPDAVRSFAVAELSEPGVAGDVVVTAVVRGTAAIDVFSVGGARRFASGGVQPWVLAEFRAVTGLVLGGGDSATGPVARLNVGSLPIGLGVVDGELLTWSLAPLERVDRATALAEASGAGGDAAAEPDEGAAEETIIRPRGGASLFGHPADPTPVAPPASAPQPSPDRGATGGDTPGPTVRPSAAEAFPPTEPVVLPPPPARFAVRIGSGDTVPLDAPVLIGRRPAPLRLSPGVPARLIAVPSPDHQVSATHVQIEQAGDAVVVTDLRSTNGTVLISAGARVRLRPGQSQVVLGGTVVEIGDGNIIEITALTAAP